MIVLEVIIPIKVNRSFYYLPNINFFEKSKYIDNFVGRRVSVCFRNKVLIAYVISCLFLKKTDNLKYKKVISIIDDKPIITTEIIKLANYISKNYFCSIGEALTLSIPIHMRQYNINRVNIKNKKSVLCTQSSNNDKKVIFLDKQQENAVLKINEKIKNNTYSSFLIHQVMSISKVNIYMEIIKQTISLGKGVIMLVPEICLITQFINIFKSYKYVFKIWNSNISNTEKYNTFYKVKNGKVNIVIGTRSAVFAPFRNLGIIIIDEEHSSIYKQNNKPEYDTRDIAIWRAKYHDAVVVFGSLTPSLESYKYALDNKITLIKLKNSIYNTKFPKIKILTVNNKLLRCSFFLPETIKCISNTINKKEQVIIFFNRKGYLTTIICTSCKKVYQCNNCSVSMVLHKDPDLLICHYCGHIERLPITCKFCNSKNTTIFGFGIQKIEEELKKIFKDIKILLLDKHIVTKKKYNNFLNDIKECNYNVFISTEMTTKMYVLSKLSLVCILDIDTFLALPNFKVSEKIFQFITKIANNFHNNRLLNNIIIQTKYPDHYAIKCAKNYDYKSFFQLEMKHREIFFYPPYCEILKVLIRNKKNERTIKDTKSLYLSLKDFVIKSNLKLKVLGPITEYIHKLKNYYREQIIIKGKKEDILKVAEYINKFKHLTGTSIYLETYAYDLG
ncbi:MAG: primosomal protein N' [Endomicrobium sp.]|jgi:primosomal protein N' (replication factor Y)|nr:primosomal protein N' [Endomicrobium sp.]